MSDAEESPYLNQKKCWLIGTGAFSCRPEGALGPRSRVTPIDLTGNLSCYTLLGRFIRLNIIEAFGIHGIEDIR